MKYVYLAAALGLSACGGTASQSSAPAASCGADGYQDLIGQDAAAAIALPEPKRSYRPDDAITTDFVAERLNIQLDRTDTIIAVTCG